MNYAEISKETMSLLYKSYISLKDSPLDQSIRALVELRTSQINGCAYCCKLHIEEARKLGIPQEKLDLLVTWHTSSIFSEKEMLALQWCEEITLLDSNTTETKKLLLQYFSEREIVDLTACCAIMNSLNRLAISLKE